MPRFRITITGDFNEKDDSAEESLRQAVIDAAEESGMTNVKARLEDEDCIRINDARDAKEKYDIP